MDMVEAECIVSSRETIRDRGVFKVSLMLEFCPLVLFMLLHLNIGYSQWNSEVIIYMNLYLLMHVNNPVENYTAYL